MTYHRVESVLWYYNDVAREEGRRTGGGTVCYYATSTVTLSHGQNACSPSYPDSHSFSSFPYYGSYSYSISSW